MRHLIESSLHGPWYRLGLPQPLEARYRQEVPTPSGWYLQSWLVIFIVFNLLSTWMDIDTFGVRAIAVPFGLTVGVFVPVACLSIFACRGRPSQSRQAIIAAINAILDMAIILNSARLAPATKADAYMILAALVPFAAGSIVTIPFRHALWFYGLSFGLFVLVTFAPPLSDRFEAGIPLLCAGLILVPLKISFSREHELKRTFLLSLLSRVQADELQAANARLVVLSGTDPLTGLYNRRAFSDGLEKAWLEAQRTKEGFGVILADIDLFKLFNDSEGHAHGDSCLIDVANAMSAVVSENGGTIGRYGGEEFAAYLPNASPQIVGAVAKRMVKAVRALAIPHGGLPDGGTVSVSIGVAAASGGDELGIETLLARADAALYAAKHAGRDRAVGDETMAASATIAANGPRQNRALADAGPLEHDVPTSGSWQSDRLPLAAR